MAPAGGGLNKEAKGAIQVADIDSESGSEASDLKNILRRNDKRNSNNSKHQQKSNYRLQQVIN
jgi:hypothetical protein